MFLSFEDVILIRDLRKSLPEDAPVYLWKRQIAVEDQTCHETLWPVYHPITQAEYERAGMTRYGTIYQDAGGRWCVIPDTWSEDDAQKAKSWIG